MNKWFYLYLILLSLISCKSENKNVMNNLPKDYYIIIDDALQVMTISGDSIGFTQIVSTTDDYFGSDPTTSFRTKEKSVKIIEMTKSGSQIEIYASQDKKITKRVFLIDSSKQKLSALFEDTLFDNLKSAKSYKPDLQKKFLFDYYTKDYLSSFQSKPKLYNCDSTTIHEFIENYKNTVISNKAKFKNTIIKGQLIFFLQRELLNKTLIVMDLNPFIAARSESLDAIFKMIPKIE